MHGHSGAAGRSLPVQAADYFSPAFWYLPAVPRLLGGFASMEEFVQSAMRQIAGLELFLVCLGVSAYIVALISQLWVALIRQPGAPRLDQTQKQQTRGKEGRRQEETRRSENFRRQGEQEARRERETRKQQWRKQERREHEAEQEARREQQARTKQPQNWWDVLGVSPPVNLDEIRRAYYSKIKLYHPDLLNGLAPELVQIAEEKTKELNRAFAEARRSFHA
jgi:flagellar biosynthesis GTPase FlhF